MQIEELTSYEFEELSKRIKGVILPVGSIEAHGPHLPLGTDLFTIYEICKRVIKRIEVFLAPPLYFGLCRSTRDIPGTLSLRGETLKSLLFDLLESFYRQGLRKFIILSGHAGGTHNAFIIDTAEQFIEKYPQTRFFVADIINLLKDTLKELGIPENDSHAGEWETSLILYLKNELVKPLDKAFEDYPAFPKYQVVPEKKLFWASGIWGNPLKATPEKGKIITEQLIIKLTELLSQFLSS
ncbi:creatinine amidohydrolase [Caldimicrobium thiodismutans]|jgi:creatinine amidohydrolase|uniref:Creatinine amidohydrolase n=1 Tax=Caldimicrobium thiodismutans TaxID=1653476 RepID=A0A0U5B434_9BACT|nr:creatininase family protein [Caldimicrobium thiodismutans]BAU22800.1 creatinine amidohydrolase [Caldimicrobium thiodismutans]